MDDSLMPWDDDRLDDVEQSARQCPSGDACRQDVLALVAEVRRLRSVMAVSAEREARPRPGDAGQGGEG